MVSKSLDVVVNLFNSSVDLNQKSLAISLLAIAFNPTAWNIVARNGAGPIV
jgi:phosphatidylethanolamine N-methyltransferase